MVITTVATKLFFLPTERSNKITVRIGKFFDKCIGSVSTNASVNMWGGQCIGRIRFFTLTYESLTSYSD